MSLLVTLSLSALAGATVFSVISKIKRNISESITYKTTPALYELYHNEELKLQEAKEKGCYGEMGRISSKMIQIKKEVESRVKHVRMENKIA